MKIETAKLVDGQLDWAVSQAAGMDVGMGGMYISRNSYLNVLYCAKGLDFSGTEYVFNPSTSWALGGPIIKQEGIEIVLQDEDWDIWWASGGRCMQSELYKEAGCYGPDPLIAAMRCYVEMKLGKEVDIPQEI
jgi:hypothetical protein